MSLSLKTAVPCAPEKGWGKGAAESVSTGRSRRKHSRAGRACPHGLRDVLIVLGYVPLFAFLLFCSKEIGLLLALY